MRTVHVGTGRPYDIDIERGLLDKAGEYAKRLSDAKRVVLVTDTNVAPLYQQRILHSLSACGFEATTHVFRAGEESKHLGTIAEMYNTFADFGMTRRDLVVALGGGVCGDMAGFAAASYLRGIDFMQVPTSLLAQVDSSVGGKTGVDLPQGKNLVGAFHQPVAVLIDPETLKTLPDFYKADGMAEVVKYGCIKDASFFTFLEHGDAAVHIEDVIEICVSVKRDVVNLDECERGGERILLNFGHTLGHAIEKLRHYSGISHGMAVAVGMVMMAKAGEARGITEPGTAGRIAALCQKYALPTSEQFSFAELANAARSDKKTAGDVIRPVLLRRIGDSFTQTVPIEEFESFITTED